jgi:hypothetical protein
VGMINAEGNVGIRALCYLNGLVSLYIGSRDTENESAEAAEEEGNIRQAISF